MAKVASASPPRSESVATRFPVSSFFAVAFAISWLGALAMVAPKLMRGLEVPKFAGLMMFPVMLLGPSVSGLLMTRIVDGSAGFRNLFSSMARIRVPARWYLVLLIPPALLLCVLRCLTAFVSPIYTPNRFYAGAWFGLIAGFLEEIGWTGYALPKMIRRGNAWLSAILLGAVWAIWHFPVVDYLGTATPHGANWLRYFLAFAAAMIAVRVLIAWIYRNTQSVVLAQFMHASSTAALVVLSPARASAGQEAFWYALYAGALWIIVAFVVWSFGTNSGSSCIAEIA